MSVRSPKRLLFGDAARAAVSDEVALGSRLASVTHGPCGRFVAVERMNDYPLVTKNAFSAVRHLCVANRFAELGVELLKEIVSRVHL